jgi:cytochrome d ubiquinol oxidase subunit I
MLSMAMWMALLVAPIQAVVGDMHGLNTLEHQPAKIAAIEGHWENRPGEATPLLLFGLPDMEQERTRYGLEIPALGSLILACMQVPALKDSHRPIRPPCSGRFAWLDGVLMIALGICSAWLRYRRRLYHSRPFQWFALCMGPAGLIALVAGWVTTEMGRQPWVIYGLLRTGTRCRCTARCRWPSACWCLSWSTARCLAWGITIFSGLSKKGRSR